MEDVNVGIKVIGEILRPRRNSKGGGDGLSLVLLLIGFPGTPLKLGFLLLQIVLWMRG